MNYTPLAPHSQRFDFQSNQELEEASPSEEMQDTKQNDIMKAAQMIAMNRDEMSITDYKSQVDLKNELAYLAEADGGF